MPCIGTPAALVLVGLAAALLCAPFLSAVYEFTDEGVLLRAADMMLHGRTIYRDFFEFLPPGGFVITAAWLSVVGTSLAAARALVMLAVAGTACFTFLTCRQVSRNGRLAAALAVTWVAMSQGIWTQVSHHWFTTLLVATVAWASFARLERPARETRWQWIAGIAAGAAVMVTPTRGALALLAAFCCLLLERGPRQQIMIFVAGCAAVPLALLGYLAVHGVLIDSFNDAILFTARRYAFIQSVPYGNNLGPQSLPLLIEVALAAALAVWLVVRDPSTSLRDRQLRLCMAFAVAGFIGSFPRPDVVHISFGMPLILPLLAFGMAQLGQGWPKGVRRLAIAGLTLVYLPSAIFFGAFAWQALTADRIATPRGRVAAAADLRAVLARIDGLPATDKYFVYPYASLLPYLTSRDDVSGYDVFTPTYTLPSQYRDACVTVLQRATWVVVDTYWTNPTFLRRRFPAIRNAEPPETRQFEKLLSDSFEPVARAGTFEFRKRRANVDPAACRSITVEPQKEGLLF